jgi:hypothetical protein
MNEGINNSPHGHKSSIYGMKELLIKYRFALVFVFIFLLLLIMNLWQRKFIFYFDSKYYWGLADSFDKNGKFSLLNFDSSLRAYVFPLIIYTIRKIAVLIGAPQFQFYEFVMSLVYAGFLAVLVPAFIHLLFKKEILLVNIITFCILALSFHKDLFFYPLSDLLSFSFLVMGVYLIIKFTNHLWVIVPAWLSLGMASLIRPSYLITLPVIFIWCIYFYRKELSLGLGSILIRLACILIGLILVYIPQIAINKSQFGTLSPFVQTQRSIGNDLFMLQLGSGIEIQKYETNIGKNYPVAPVNFLDKQGESVLIKSGYKKADETIGPAISLKFTQYLNLVISYPFDFICIYARHLFNGLDIVYNTTYIKNVYSGSLLLRFFNYSLWFLISSYIAKRFVLQKFQVDQLLLPFIFALPSILSIPTAIEVRFMLPVHLMAYALLSFWILPEFFKLSPSQKKNVIMKYAMWYVVFLVTCFMISSDTYMGLQFGPYVMSGNWLLHGL